MYVLYNLTVEGRAGAHIICSTDSERREPPSYIIIKKIPISPCPHLFVYIDIYIYMFSLNL